MAGQQFYKMTGSGNDFVMLDGRGTSPGEWPAGRIAAVCDRRGGVGADGLVILAPERPGVVRMHYFNSDGGRADMCGNAALCCTRLAARLELAPGAGMRLLTDAGDLATRCVGPGDMAEINLPDFELQGSPDEIQKIAGELDIDLAVVGVPHLVVRVRDIEAIDLPARGRVLRFHPALGAAGANANFVAGPDAAGGPWSIRTYERGVEAETLACGTGTVASALALAAWGHASLPVSFRSRGGSPLAVSAVLEGRSASQVWLCGQGRLVYSGTLEDPA